MEAEIIALKLPGTDKLHGIGKCGQHYVILYTTNIPGSFLCDKVNLEAEPFETRLSESDTIEMAVYEALNFMTFEMEEDPDLGVAILCALESAVLARRHGEAGRPHLVTGGGSIMDTPAVPSRAERAS